MVGTKNFTLRLDEELADQVRVLAALENKSMSDVLRDAVVEHVERRRSDPAFKRLIEKSRERHEALLQQFSRLDRDRRR